MHEVASLAAVACRTASWPHPLPEGEALRRIERARAGNESGKALNLAITLKQMPDALIGLLGAGPQNGGGDGLVVGYLLDVQHQGHGLMTEAMRALVGTVFGYSSYNTLYGASGVCNIASRRVLEKAGFRHTGRIAHSAPARRSRIPCDTLELSRDEWRSRSPARAAVRAVARGEGLPCGHAA